MYADDDIIEKWQRVAFFEETHFKLFAMMLITEKIE